MAKRTIIKNGVIYDGTGGKPYSGEVAIVGDTIEAVGVKLNGDFDEVIDAGGKVVCPGFIDTHSHSDVCVLVDSSIPPKVMQGITTEVLGQDGVSMAPIMEDQKEKWRMNIAGLEGDSDQIDWACSGTDEYLKRIEARKPTSNFAYLVPHGNIRSEVMGFSDQVATEEQLCKMEEVLRRELDAGAVGMSSGLVYIPCVYADTNEMIRLCKVLAEYGRPFVVHQRMEFNDVLGSMNELMNIVRNSGVHLHISHFKLGGKMNEPLVDDAFKMLEDMQREGYKVTFDQYPYGAGSTMLGGCIPPWAHAGGSDKLLERMKDPETREKIASDMHNNDTFWENLSYFCTPDGIVITDVVSEANKKYVGLSLEEIGKIRGVTPQDACIDLLVDENNIVGMIDHYGTEPVIKRVMCRPEMNVCTDGLLGGKPHPRVYGAFPRILGKYVREEKLFPLETAINKMTGKPAAMLNMWDRGLLKPGCKADVVVFDPDTIIDYATYADPRQYSVGIERVMVNGVTIMKDGEIDDKAACGQVIRAAK